MRSNARWSRGGAAPVRLPARSLAWRPSSGRRGVALLASLVAILLLAILAAGAMHLGRGDFQRARDEAVMRQAGNAADAGAWDVLRRWPLLPHESMPVGATWGPDTLQLAGATAVSRTIRASRTTWWVVSAASAGDSLARTLARRSVAVALRLAIPDIATSAAIVVRDSLTVAGGARIVGADTTLGGGGASCAATSPGAGVAMPDTTRLCDGSCGAGSTSGRIAGLPALLADPTAGASARYSTFGPEDWGSLTRHATVVLPPGSIITPAPAVTGGACDRARSDNWGAPGGSGPCASYAPLIWATGDVELRGGAGQGVLLVDGDLTLSAGATFAGVVIARDDVRTQGVGGTLLGAVLAGDARVAAGDHSRLEGSALVQRSTCAVELALEWSARIVPVRQRSWSALR